MRKPFFTKEELRYVSQFPDYWCVSGACPESLRPEVSRKVYLMNRYLDEINAQKPYDPCRPSIFF